MGSYLDIGMKAMTNEMKNMEVEHQAGPNEQLLQMVEETISQKQYEDIEFGAVDMDVKEFNGSFLTQVPLNMGDFSGFETADFTGFSQPTSSKRSRLIATSVPEPLFGAKFPSTTYGNNRETSTLKRKNLVHAESEDPTEPFVITIGEASLTEYELDLLWTMVKNNCRLVRGEFPIDVTMRMESGGWKNVAMRFAQATDKFLNPEDIMQRWHRIRPSLKTYFTKYLGLRYDTTERKIPAELLSYAKVVVDKEFLSRCDYPTPMAKGGIEKRFDELGRNFEIFQKNAIEKITNMVDDLEKAHAKIERMQSVLNSYNIHVDFTTIDV